MSQFPKATKAGYADGWVPRVSSIWHRQYLERLKRRYKFKKIRKGQSHRHYILLLLLALQSLTDVSIFQNCPPLFSVQRLMSPVPHAHVLHIFLSRPQPHQPTFSYTSSAFWFRTSFLRGSISCILKRCPSHLNIPIFITACVQFIVGDIMLIILSCSPYTIIVNGTVYHS